MTIYDWSGGTGTLSVAANWQTLDAQNSLEVATVAPGITDDLEIAVAASLLGSIAVKDIDIDAAISIDATTTVDADALIGNTAVASVTVAGGTWTETGYLVVANSLSGGLTIGSAGIVDATTDLTVGQSAGVTGTVLIGGNGTLSTGGFSAIAEAANATGTVTVDGSGALWTMTGELSVGDLGNGTLKISDGGAVVATGTQPNYYAGVEIGTTAGASGTIVVSAGGLLDSGPADLVVGFSGTGTLVVQGGTVAASIDGYSNIEGALILGWSFAATPSVHGNGFVTVDGAGSLIRTDGPIYVGETGSGQMTIEAAGTVTMMATTLSGVSAMVIGDVAGSFGAVTVTGTASLLSIASSDLEVANAGAGSLTIANNATVSVAGIEANNVPSVQIGVSAGASGAVTISTGGVLDTGPADLTVGNSGAGTLLVQGGTVLDSASGYTTLEAGLVLGWSLAATPSAHGTGVVTVNGTGSLIKSDGAIWVGQTGTGDMTIENAGTVAMVGTALGTDAAVVVGNKAGSTGTVTVTGTSSLLTAGNGRLSIGDDGAGVLLVTQGGTVLASAAAYPDAEPAVRIGENADGSGSATIEGAGSTLAADGAIWVSQDGPGTLVIGTGAGVSAGGTNDGGEGLIVSQGSGSGDVQVNGGSLAVSDSALIGAHGTLAATGGGSVTIGGAVSLVSVGALDTDSASTIVVGGTAGATAGAIVIDAGGSVDGGGLLSGNLIDNGTLLANDGRLVVAGTITGTGTLNIAAGGLLLLEGPDNGIPVVFDTQGSGNLELAGASLSGNAITGFGAGSAITIDNAVGATASITTAGGVTTLALAAGISSLGTLEFAGAPSVHFNATTGVVTAGNTYDWAGGNGLFGTAANWLDVLNGNSVSTVVPGPADVAQVLDVGNVTISGTGAVAAFNVDDNTGTFPTGTVTLTGAVAATTIDITDSVLVLSGATASLTQAVGDGLYFFVGQSPSGTLLIENGATAQAVGSNNLDQPNIVIGDIAAGGGNVTVDGTGSELNAGDGAIDVNAGGLLAISGGGAVLALASAGPVGSFAFLEGTATPTLGTGGAAFADAAGPVTEVYRAATVTIDGTGSVLRADGLIGIGDTQSASFAVSNNGLVVATVTSEPTNDPAFLIGDQVGATGIVTVSSGGTIDAGGGAVAVGMSGVGTLDVDGGTVRGGSADYATAAPAFMLGWAWYLTPTTGGTGVVAVTGADSTIEADGQMLIGYLGTGTLTISAGGLVEMTGNTASLGGNSGVVLASDAGSTGTVTVTGTGSILNAGVGRLNVGSGGSGVLMVTQGGTVLASAAAYGADSTAVRIGYSASATGSATIEGGGATLAANGAVVVGVSGTGTLVVGSGGTVGAGGTNDGGVGLIVNSGTGTGDVQVAGGVLAVSDAAAVNANGTLAVSAGGSVTIAGGLALAAGGTLSVDATSFVEIGSAADAVAGAVVVDAGQTLLGAGGIAANVVVNGTLQATGSLLNITGNISGSGTVAAASGGTLAVAGTFDGTLGGDGGALLTIGGGSLSIVAGASSAKAPLTLASVAGNDVAFATGPGQTLSPAAGVLTLSGYSGGGDSFLGSSAALAGETIQNWATADTLDLTDMGFAAAHLSYAGIATGGTLTVTDGTHTAGIGFSGDLSGGNFVLLGNDGHGGTLIGWHA